MFTRGLCRVGSGEILAFWRETVCFLGAPRDTWVQGVGAGCCLWGTGPCGVGVKGAEAAAGCTGGLLVGAC